MRKNKRYQKVNEETRQKMKDIDKIELSKDDWEIINQALSVINEKSAENGGHTNRDFWML